MGTSCAVLLLIIFLIFIIFHFYKRHNTRKIATKQHTRSSLITADSPDEITSLSSIDLFMKPLTAIPQQVIDFDENEEITEFERPNAHSPPPVSDQSIDMPIIIPHPNFPSSHVLAPATATSIVDVNTEDLTANFSATKTYALRKHCNTPGCSKKPSINDQ